MDLTNALFNDSLRSLSKDELKDTAKEAIREMTHQVQSLSPTAPTDIILWDLREAGRNLNISVSTLTHEPNEGIIKALRIGKKVLCQKDELITAGRKVSITIKKNLMSKHKICLYDGATILIKDANSIKHIKSNPQKYHLKGSYDMASGEELNQFEGKYRNFDIRTGGNRRGSGVFIGGSLHKWKNRSHNYDTFYWHEFLQVYSEIIDEFQFDPKQAYVCSLEAGINIPFSKNWSYKAADIPKNVILFKNVPRSSVRKIQPKGGYLLENTKGEIAAKMYDKGKQFRLSKELLRIENRFLKHRVAGIKVFSELLDQNKHKVLADKLVDTFKSLILFQPEILKNCLLPEQDKRFLLEIENANAWIRLRKERRYKEFEKRESEYNTIINKYAAINYKSEILAMMEEQLR